MRRILKLTLGVLVVGVPLAGCSTPQACPGACVEYEGATFELACSPNDLVRVAATGPCADPDASLSWYTGVGSERYVVVPAVTQGTCNIVLTFATGFTYAQDVTFDVVSRDSCGCPSYIAPTAGPFTVNNPSDTCVAPTSAADASD